MLVSLDIESSGKRYCSCERFADRFEQLTEFEGGKRQADSFVEGLIGTIQHECLDQLLFWTRTDLEMKLIAYRDFYNRHRTHAGLIGATPIQTPESRGANLKCYRWQSHCLGLYQTPIAA
jgi:hypothetical protein